MMVCALVRRTGEAINVEEISMGKAAEKRLTTKGRDVKMLSRTTQKDVPLPTERVSLVCRRIGKGEP